MNKMRNIHTFVACDHEYEESSIVLFGAPFDGTASYRPGTRFASSAVRNESYSIETYSPYLDLDLEDKKIFDAGDLNFGFGDTHRILKAIEEMTELILSDNKKPLMVGGEHLVTLGSMRAAVRKYPELHIIHFDAHTDLREEFLGDIMSHATVLRKCWDLVGDGRIYQFGIRSGSREEFLWAKNHVFMQKFNLDRLDDCVKALKDKPVYLTIDLDVLDPGEFPGTGTPEAGGIHFTELIDALKQVFTLNIVMADVVELSPALDPSGSSTALACKLLREIMLQL